MGMEIYMNWYRIEMSGLSFESVWYECAFKARSLSKFMRETIAQYDGRFIVLNDDDSCFAMKLYS